MWCFCDLVFSNSKPLSCNPLLTTSARKGCPGIVIGLPADVRHVVDILRRELRDYHAITGSKIECFAWFFIFLFQAVFQRETPFCAFSHTLFLIRLSVNHVWPFFPWAWFSGLSSVSRETLPNFSSIFILFWCGDGVLVMGLLLLTPRSSRMGRKPRTTWLLDWTWCLCQLDHCQRCILPPALWLSSKRL